MSRPQAKEELVRQYLAEVALPSVEEPVALLGVRGYYRDTMGQQGTNDVGIYDDAMFLVAPKVFIAVNANTDPSRLGWNPSIGKPYAMLMPGLWYFIMGPHKGKIPALRQADEDEALDHNIPDHGHFSVWRSKDGRLPAPVDKNYHAINIHRGGEQTTSSWGCQTIPPDQFLHFMDNVWAAAKTTHQKRIPYFLIDGPIN